MANIPRFEQQQPRIKRWSPGERLTAADLNGTVMALLHAGQGLPLPAELPDLPGLVARFRVVSVGVDLLVCRGWDGTTEYQTDVNVALPYQLRKTPFDGETIGGITYTYSSNTAREADDGTDTEDQIIIPAYTADDEIIAVRGIVRGCGVEDTNKVPWIWHDLNTDARAWAAEVV